jgi:hypothetical protein
MFFAPTRCGTELKIIVMVMMFSEWMHVWARGVGEESTTRRGEFRVRVWVRIGA